MNTDFEAWKQQRKAAEGGTVQTAETAFERWKRQHKENERNYYAAVDNPEGTGVNAASWITQRNQARDGKTPTAALPDKTPNEMSRSTTDITLRNQLRDAEADEKAAGAAYRETLKSGDQQARLDAGRAVGEANARKREAQQRIEVNEAAATAYGYTVLRQDPDYENLSKPDAELMERGRKAPDFSGFLGSRGTNINLYYNINSRDALRAEVSSAPGSVGEYAYMTDEEAANFNYIFKKQGAEAARAYYDQLTPELNRRRTERTEAAWVQRTHDAPVASDIASVGANLIGGVSGIASLTAQNVQRYLTRSDEPVDYNTGAMLGIRIAQTIRETRAQDVAEKHPKELGGANIASFLYQTGMSMADSAVIVGLTLFGVPGATALLGGSAAAQSAIEVRERGGTDAQALGYGLAAGIAESLFEAISLDKIIQPTARGLAAGLRNVLRQAFTEGSEEVATTLANTLTDRIINGDTDALSLDIRRYQEMGYSDRDAAKKALVGWLQGLAGDFLGGVISGGVMTGGKVAATNLVGGVQDARTAAAQTRQERAAQNANPVQGAESDSDIMEAPETSENRGAAPEVPGAGFTEASDAAALTPLDRALRTLESGETLSGQSVRRVMEDADSMERLRDSGALPEAVRPGAEGRRQVADAVETYRGIQDTPGTENAQSAAQEASDAGENLLTQTVRNDTMTETGNMPNTEGENGNGRAEVADGGLLRTAGGNEGQTGDADGTGAGRRSERGNRVGPGGQSSETFLESLRSAGKQRERQRSIRYALEALGLDKVSAASIGVENGTENATLSVLPDTPTDERTEKLLEGIGFRRMQRVFARDGITVRGFTGTLEFADGRGVHTARGWTSADGSTVYVALDHATLRYDQILMHEHFHVLARRNRALLREVAAKFDESFTEAERRAIVNDYMDAYGYYDVSEDYVLEEVLADYYGGIDVFAGTEDAQADFDQRRAAVTAAVKEADRSGQTRTEADTGQRFSREILELVTKVKNGTAKDGDSVDFGIISDRNAQRIYDAVGIDVRGYAVKLEARQIRHILKDHGENGETDHSMKNDADIARIPYEMEAAFDVRDGGRSQAYREFSNGYLRSARTVLYESENGNNSYYVVEAVPNTKKKTIYVVSAFIGKPGYKNETSQAADAKSPGVTSETGSVKSVGTVARGRTDVKTSGGKPGYKKEASQFADAISPDATSEIAAAHLSGTISQNRNAVNENYENESGKFSRELDSRGEQLSPQQAEYFRDSKVRDAQGRLKVMYHISDSGDIGVFQSGNSAGLIYFAESEKAARMGARGSKAAYRVYLNAVNPVNEKTAPVNWYDAEDSITVAEWKRNGYDGVYVKDESGVSFAVFSPEQIKRTDNVNPTNDSDIRFSRNLPGETAELQDEYDELKKKLNYWKGQVKRTEVFTLRETDTRRLTKSVLSDYSSRADAADIGARIKKLGEYLMNGDGDGVSWVDAHDDAVRIARDIIQNASALVDDGERDTYRRMKSYFHGLRIRVTNAKANITDYNSFRKRNFGRFILADDGTPIDALWTELQETFGKGYFPDDVMTQEDQIEHVADLLDSLRDTYENPYREYYAQAVEYCANDILDRLLSDEVRQTPKTFADRAEERLARQSIRYEDKLERQAEQLEERYQRRVLKDEERYQRVRYLLDQERENRKARIEELRRDRRSRDAREREKRRAAALRAKIGSHARELTSLLLKPSDKRHIPKGLEKPVAALLSAIDLSSGYVLEYGADAKYHRVDAALSLGGEETKRTAAFRQIREQLQKMAGEWADDGTLFGDAEEAGLLTTVIEDYADIPLAKMNSEQLQTVWDAVKTVEGAIRSMNRLFSTERWADQAELAAAIRDENRGKKKKQFRLGTVAGLDLGKLQDVPGIDSLTPEAYFHRLGSVGDTLFRLAADAQDEEIRIRDEAARKTREIMGDTDVRELEREMHPVTFGGETVTISTAQLMELYALSRRDQGLQHILTGGVVIEETRRGLVRKGNPEPLRITQKELSDALLLLTARQRSIAEQLQDYLSTDMAAVGNKAAMKVYNYEKFGKEKHYWTIRTNKNEVATEIGSDNRVTTPAQRGFTKAVKPNAKTSLKIGSIFDTYSKHIVDMSNYAAWLAFTEDMNRVRNFNFRDESGISTGTVKSVLDSVHGHGGAAYLETLLADISNGTGIDDRAPTDVFVGNYKAAAVGANLRVILQQPTAILRAADMIDPKYLAAGLKNPMRAFEEAKKYAPIAVWKDWGYFDLNTGRQMKDVLFENTDKLARARELSMSLAGKADSFAWGQLWNAVKAETKDKTDLTPGTKEFYDRAARRFREIIDRTQVVDGILQRSQAMRSKNWLNKVATSFMSEPTKQYNMFRSAVYDAKNGDTAAKKRLARTTAALLISGIVNTVVQSLWDAVRDDDKDKEYWEKFLSAFVGYDSENDGFRKAFKAYFNSNVGAMLNPGSYIPYAKDIVSLLQGYDVSRMDMDAIDGTIKAATSWMKAVSGEGKKTVGFTTLRLTENAAKLLGIPLYNIERDLTAIVDTIASATNSYPLQYQMYSAINRTPDSGTPNKDVTAMLYRAYMADNGDYEQLVRMMTRDGYHEDEMQKQLEAKWKKEHGITDALKAANTDGGGYSQQNIVSAVDALKLPTETTDLILAMELGDSQRTKYAAARRMGIAAEQYTEAVLTLPRFDANGNGSYSGGEVEAALKDMDGLTNKERAILWQTLSASSSAKNNPFDAETGTEYLIAAGNAKLPELTLPTADGDAADFSGAFSTAEEMSDEDRLAAYGAIIGTEMTTESGKPTQWARLNTAVEDGVSVDDALRMAQEDTLDDYMRWRDSDAKKAGVNSDVYITYRTETAKMSADKDKDGKSISGSKKQKVVAYIHRLKLTAKQKDALYLDAGYTEKEIDETPWNRLTLPTA